MTLLMLSMLASLLSAVQDPGFEQAFNDGVQALQGQRWEEAAARFQAACPLRPRDFNCWYALGAARARLGQTDAALEAWRRADSIEPRHPRLLQLLTVEYAKGRYFQDALSAAKRALTLAPGDLNARLLAIKAAQDAGDADWGAATAAAAVAAFPGSARANFEHAFYLQKAGKLAEAADHLQKAMALDPQYEEPFFFYGDVLTKSGRAAESLTYFRRAIAIRPDYIPARVSLARALMSAGQLPEALRELEETVRRDPGHPQPHLLLSQIYFREGKEDLARRERELSLRLRRENPALLEAPQGRAFAASARP